MPILLTDIIVPEKTVKNKYEDDESRCSLCNELLTFNYNYEPEPHTLDACLRKLFEKVMPL